MKKLPGLLLSFFLLLALPLGVLSAQTTEKLPLIFQAFEQTSPPPGEIVPPWEEELRKLEALLDNWAKDSEAQAKELDEFQRIVDSLNLSLMSSEEDLNKATKSVVFWKEKAETEEKKATAYKLAAIGGAALAVIGWTAFAIAVH